jgi:drug/metabolite transporter (DMT)-like permease
MKLGVQHMPPLWFATVRIFLGALFLFGLLIIQGRYILPKKIDIKIIVTISIFQIALPTALIHSGLQYLGAGRSAILVFTMPLWVAPLAYFILKEKINSVKFVGLILGLSGIGILFNPLAFDFSNQSLLFGNSLMLLASFSFASAIILLRRSSSSTPIIQLVPWQLLLGSFFLAISAVSFEGMPQIKWTPSLLTILAYNGPIASGFCFWAYIYVSSSLPAMNTSIGSLGIPVIGVLSSSIIIGETLNYFEVLGLIMVLLGVLLVSFNGLIKLELSTPLK